MRRKGMRWQSATLSLVFVLGIFIGVAFLVVPEIVNTSAAYELLKEATAGLEVISE